MILKSIRLHPFASFTDKTIDFNKGMNVIYGENEAGKSTLFRSIRAVLFYSVHPAKNSSEYRDIQKYFPLPQSNFTHVTLKFTCNGEEGELSKLWSTNQKEGKALLTYKGQSIIVDKDVAEAMAQLLKLNRASWEHILFIPQSSIQHTISDLKDNSNQLQSIDQSLQKENGDIDAAKFLASIRDEIERYYQRWDKENSQPEGGKGVNNPWKQNVGKILEAYYEKEKIVASLIQLEATTDKLDIINKNIYEIEALVSPLEAFIKEGQPLLADATAREGIENNIAQIDTKINPFKGIYKEWILLEGTLPEFQNQHIKSEERLNGLKEEIINSENNTLENNELLDTETGSENPTQTISDLKKMTAI
jgi:DNA repair exonuclease SbcCD ATPase subunit